MRRIITIADVQHGGLVMPRGEPIEVADALADRLIRIGAAVETEEEPRLVFTHRRRVPPQVST